MEYQQKSLRMPGTPRPKRPKFVLPDERDYIMTDFGGSMTEREHVIRGIRAHVPNRFAEQVREMQCELGEEPMTDEQFEEQDGPRDLTGYITLGGQKVRVCTGCYQDVEVWEIDRYDEREE